MTESGSPSRSCAAARLTTAGLLLLWLTALVGYFGPWVGRRPASAALGWNAYDLFALLRLLPEIESAALSVNLQTLQLPLLALAVLLPMLLTATPPPRIPLVLRVAVGGLSLVLALITMPPYPQILTAWRTPGWRVPFWWGAATVIAVLLALWKLPELSRRDRQGYRHWLMVGIAELAVAPAVITFYRLLPALRALHAAPVAPGWGFWLCMIGLGTLGIVAWVRALRSDGRERLPS